MILMLDIVVTVISDWEEEMISCINSCACIHARTHTFDTEKRFACGQPGFTCFTSKAKKKERKEKAETLPPSHPSFLIGVGTPHERFTSRREPGLQWTRRCRHQMHAWPWTLLRLAVLDGWISGLRGSDPKQVGRRFAHNCSVNLLFIMVFSPARWEFIEEALRTQQVSQWSDRAVYQELHRRGCLGCSQVPRTRTSYRLMKKSGSAWMVLLWSSEILQGRKETLRCCSFQEPYKTLFLKSNVLILLSLVYDSPEVSTKAQAKSGDWTKGLISGAINHSKAVVEFGLSLNTPFFFFLSLNSLFYSCSFLPWCICNECSYFVTFDVTEGILDSSCCSQL